MGIKTSGAKSEDDIRSKLPVPSPKHFVLPPPSSDDFVEGGNLNLAWSDCGDSSYHAKVQSLAPTTLPIGKTTTVTGSGKVDKQVTEGAFAIVAKFGPVTEHYSGDICAKKVFHLPAFLGQITWDGLSCPVATGSVSVGVDVKLASIIPAKLAVGDISIKAAETKGSQDHLICLDIKTSGAKSDDGIYSMLPVPSKRQFVPTPSSSEDFVEGGNLNLAWSDCGDSSYHAKVQSLAPTTLPIGKTTTVTGSGK